MIIKGEDKLKYPLKILEWGFKGKDMKVEKKRRGPRIKR
jgi:hypothetical protein